MSTIYEQSTGIVDKIRNCMDNLRKYRFSYSSPKTIGAVRTQVRLLSELRRVQEDDTLKSESGRLIAEVGKSLNGVL